MPLPAAPAPQHTSDEVVRYLAGRVGRGLGPPGGEVRSLALAPSEPDRLYAGTATGHLYASSDGAEHWRSLPVGLPHEAVIDNLIVHPGNADVVYAAYWTPAGRGGLLRTRDGGDTWEPLPVPGDPSLRAIAAAPSNPRILYVGGIGGVWRSDDGGDTWYNANGQGLATEFVESLAIDPRDPQHVYAGTWRQVYRSRDGGSHWRRIYQGMATDRDIFSLAIDPSDPDTVLAGTCNFLYCSNNGGGSWDERRTGLAREHNRVHVILHDRNDAATLYAGTRGALYRSTDAGKHWNMVLGGVSVSALALAPDGSRLYVGTEERGVMQGPPAGPFVEANRGIYSARVTAFDALPGAPRVLFAARADGPDRVSIHLSTDTGRSWRSFGPVPGTGGVRTIRAQAQPVNRVLVLGDGGWWSVSPPGRWAGVTAAPGHLQAVEIAHAAGGTVLAATDSGLYAADPTALGNPSRESQPFDEEAPPAWVSLWEGRGLRALAVSGQHYLAVAQHLAVRGRTAAARSTPAEVVSVEGFDAEPLGVALGPSGSIAYAISEHDVYRSSDGGVSWTKLPLPWPAAELRAVAIDPADPDQVLALDYRGAIYRGHDAGTHWLVLDQDYDLARAWALRLSAQAPGFALVATQGYGLRVVGIDPLALERRRSLTSSH